MRRWRGDGSALPTRWVVATLVRDGITIGDRDGIACGNRTVKENTIKAVSHSLGWAGGDRFINELTATPS